MISVICAVNDDQQLRENVLASPGLKEIETQIIPITGARNAAHAYYEGLKQATGDWTLYCHQDVYWPVGSGSLIKKKLDTISQYDAPETVIGFAGKQGSTSCGLVLDRGNLLDFGATTTDATSIDELAVILYRYSALKIDPALGWHLWATDLCFQARRAEIVQIPVHHNSKHGYTLPREFHESGKVLFNKWPKIRPILTLCGDIR